MGSVPQTGIGSRELLWCPPPVRSPNMDNLATSLMELWNTPGVAEKVEETARVYFANSILTINLIPALLVGALLLFLLPPLLGFPLLNGLLGARWRRWRSKLWLKPRDQRWLRSSFVILRCSGTILRCSRAFLRSTGTFLRSSSALL